MNSAKSKDKQTNKKPYLPPEVQAFQSLKEITLAITCGCAYWGDQAYNFCAYCAPTGQLKEVTCPGPDTPSSCWEE